MHIVFYHIITGIHKAIPISANIHGRKGELKKTLEYSAFGIVILIIEAFALKEIKDMWFMAH